MAPVISSARDASALMRFSTIEIIDRIPVTRTSASISTGDMFTQCQASLGIIVESIAFHVLIFLFAMTSSSSRLFSSGVSMMASVLGATASSRKRSNAHVDVAGAMGCGSFMSCAVCVAAFGGVPICTKPVAAAAAAAENG